MSSACLWVGINRYPIIIREKHNHVEVEVPYFTITITGESKGQALEKLCEILKSQICYQIS